MISGVVHHAYSRHEVDDLVGGTVDEVVPTLMSTITIHPLQTQLTCRHGFVRHHVNVTDFPTLLLGVGYLSMNVPDNHQDTKRELLVMSGVGRSFKLFVSFNSVADGTPLYFKMDGARFKEERTIKACCGVQYKINITVRPVIGLIK